MAELSDIRVVAIATHGVEESELVEPMRALREAGALLEVLSPDGQAIQGMRGLDKTNLIQVDGSVERLDGDEYDGLLLPGGAYNADKLRMDETVREFVRRTDMRDKPLAVICHAPWVPVSTGIVDDRTLTSFYTIQDDIRNAGGNWVDKEVVVDGNLVTSRKPDDIPAFNREFIRLLAEVPRAARRT
jgi:protease I